MSEGISALCEGVVRSARAVKQRVRLLSGAKRTELLEEMAQAMRAARRAILDANAEDLDRGAGLAPAMRDRLRLDEGRLEAMACAVEGIARQPDPLGRTVEERVLASGIRLEKRRVPIGVVLVVYEARPNVTSDAAALCLKAGNAVVLKGGSEAASSNRAIVRAIKGALDGAGLGDAVGFVDTADRSAVARLVAMEGLIDLAIPRGGPGLMRAVVESARVPVVKHDAGNCHVYIDACLDGLEEAAERIVVNAKAQRPGVCNAAEKLLIHRAQAERMTPRLCAALVAAGIEVRADDAARRLFPEAKPASENDWATEYLDRIIAVRIVESLEDACAHIVRYGSEHTEAIVTASSEAAERFTSLVDSASVMVNCSTRFADGGEYGLGAEIGISTGRLHARGPMGAEDLTTVQWVARGTGQVRH